MDGPRNWVTTLGAGLAAGLLAGLFGVGGGVILVPLLVLLLGRTQHQAHATSLVAIVLAAFAGGARYAAAGEVAWGGAAALAAGAVVAAAFGVRVLPRLTESTLRRAFGVLLVVLALRLLLAGSPDTAAGEHAIALGPGVIALHIAGGVATGALSAIFGVGGGVIMVPLLVIAFGYPQHLAEGTSLVVIIPTALSGALAHGREGYTQWGLGIRLGLGGVVGALLGAQLALSLPADTLARSFGALLAVVAVLLLTRSRRTPEPT